MCCCRLQEAYLQMLNPNPPEELILKTPQLPLRKPTPTPNHNDNDTFVFCTMTCEFREREKRIEELVEQNRGHVAKKKNFIIIPQNPHLIRPDFYIFLLLILHCIHSALDTTRHRHRKYKVQCIPRIQIPQTQRFSPHFLQNIQGARSMK